MISFIHLSDIHFTRFSGDKYDIDEDLRNELLNDIKHNAKRYLKNIKGVLICGDIAFSGKKEEYIVASDFLREVCSRLEIAEEDVYCVPGNHDVDQNIPKDFILVKLAQDKLAASKTTDAFDDILAQFSRDKQTRKLIFDPIECYNFEFAGKYGCMINTDKPKWEADFPLDSKYMLRIVGMNSTIISNADDHASGTDERLMFIGQHQIPSRRDNTVLLTLCHHPTECWKDQDFKLKRKMDSRVHIQLYGHKHTQTIQRAGDTLIIGSGATHPSRREPDWVPRYNWITLDITNEDCLDIKIFPRILDENDDHFIADNKLCGEEIYINYKISLIQKKNNQIEDSFSMNDAPVVINRRTNKFSYKSLIYEFLGLPYVTRETIIALLSLERKEDKGLKHVQIIDRIIRRAEEQKCIDQLWKEIQKSKN